MGLPAGEGLQAVAGGHLEMEPWTDRCFPCRHIENWRGLHTLNAVDMELYTGLQKL